MIRTILIQCIFLIVATSVHATIFDHGAWDALLQENVIEINGGKATQVNYDGMLEKRDQLVGYLQSLEAIPREQFDAWDKESQLAFLINVYNSWTVELILTKYPDLKSIKDLGSLFRSPWKKEIVKLFGKKYSLDDIEHRLIRGSDRYNDPRIHFAVNCASIGCPALSRKAYTGDGLQQQLEEAMSLFMSDTSRNRFNGKVLEVSSIFKWYREDFEKGWRGQKSLAQFLASRSEDLGLNKGQQESVAGGHIKITFLNYGWGLNRVQ